MTWADDRRADRIAEREQDRADARARFERQQAALEAKADRKRREREAAADRRRKAAAAARARRGQRRIARRNRWGKAARWLAANPVPLFVGYVMAASVIPAVISQVAALDHAGVWFALAVLLASMIEGGAWALTFMGKQAEDAGRPTWKYRVGAWATAAVASVIQAWHWAMIAPAWVAFAFALSSLFAVFLWDLKTHGSHGPTRAERAERKARAAQDRRRRERFPEVWRRFEDILDARPIGGVDRERVWAEAWFDVHGAPPSQTEQTIARRIDAATAVEYVLADADRTPESMAVDRFLADLFHAHGKGDDGPGGTPVRGPSGRPPQGGPKAATALGGKGKKPSRRPVAAGSVKEPTAADLDKVRRLADALGDPRKLSLRNVREVIGGGRNEYAIRVRDAVKKERGVL